jgi:hypothetical protein
MIGDGMVGNSIKFKKIYYYLIGGRGNTTIPEPGIEDQNEYANGWKNYKSTNPNPRKEKKEKSKSKKVYNGILWVIMKIGRN